MDSQSGGIPSPIIMHENVWRFFSLPIPTKYSQICYDEIYLFDEISVSKFIKDVAPKRNDLHLCHLDPDISKSMLNIRPENWKKNFGQVKQAQSHLESKNIGKGDVFLFFGWFQFAEYKNGKFNYIKNNEFPNGFHSIYGYLQINEIYKPNKEPVPKWLEYHPHEKFKDSFDFNWNNNTIYVSDSIFKSNYNINKKGSDLLAFSEDLILTKKGQPFRSIWQLPLILHPKNGLSLTYNKKNRWSVEDNKAILKSSARGQEFIFEDNESKAENWCVEIINQNSVKY